MAKFACFDISFGKNEEIEDFYINTDSITSFFQANGIVKVVFQEGPERFVVEVNHTLAEVIRRLEV